MRNKFKPSANLRQRKHFCYRGRDDVSVHVFLFFFNIHEYTFPYKLIGSPETSLPAWFKFNEYWSQEDNSFDLLSVHVSSFMSIRGRLNVLKGILDVILPWLFSMAGCILPCQLAEIAVRDSFAFKRFVLFFLKFSYFQ